MDIQTVHPFVIFFAAITTNNILLTNFLGMCSFLAVSKDLKSSLGLGAAVIFVSTCTAPINWLVYHKLLVPYELEYLQYIAFIIVIAAFTQIIEMVIERVSTLLYLTLGIFLPLITVNCAILGCALFLVIRQYTFMQSIAYGMGAGTGWALAIAALAGIRSRMEKKSKVIPELEGAGIALVITGIIAMAFIGFSGIVRIN
ncbi:MAG: NADH:ubiquinone reductase (Na(+)-transporting) subunit E [Candidatus Riflebacteria bacterium]|nr:NADH:ubiquinone reductase (Na(+)-transporting) subunit E [Candidatus Riflebacteria bacterium]